MELKFLSINLALLFVAACQNLPQHDFKEALVTNETMHHAPDQTPEKFTHVVLYDTPYYLDGPQQAKPQDGYFRKDTQLMLIKNMGSYSLVESAEKIKAYVAESAMKEIQD